MLNSLRIILCGLICAAATTSANAVEFSTLIFGKSYHFNRNLNHVKGYNEVNPGLGLELNHNGWLGGVLTYHDSYSKQAKAVYGGYRWNFPISDNAKLEVNLRAGYLDGSGRKSLMVLPSVGIGFSNAVVEFSVVPAFKHNDGVAAVWVRFDF